MRITQRFNEEVRMRQSALISTAVSNIQKDVLSQPLQLLSGVDILGNASSALSNMSKGVAALSMDKKFIQSRQKQVFGNSLTSGTGLILDLEHAFNNSLYIVSSRIAKELKTLVTLLEREVGLLQKVSLEE